MKLLDRQSIHNDLQEQRKSQIEEGVRLAKRIDVLRETLASIEKQHQDFLEGSRLELQKAIGPLTAKKEELEREIQKLEEYRSLLREPLDEEWGLVAEAKEKNIRDALSLSLQETSLQTRESGVLEKEQGSDRREKALNDMQESIENDRTVVSREKEKAINLTKQLEEDRKQSVSEQQERERITLKKDEGSDRRARALDKREMALSVREKDLIRGEKALQDKYQTLLRTIKRKK